MNLTTARFITRAREVGMRKVVGAHRSQLMVQFFSETILLSCIAFGIALVLVWICIPVFNDLTGIGVTYNWFAGEWRWLGLIGLVLLVGLFSGSYPALFLSALQPLSILKAWAPRSPISPSKARP